MSNKALRQSVFFVYTLLIYIFSLFIGCLVVLTHDGWKGLSLYMKECGKIIYNTFYAILFFPQALPDGDAVKILVLLYLAVAISIYALPFILWYRKQTILKAWGISIFGFFLGPGLLACLFYGKKFFDLMLLSSLAIICIFYLFLYYGNKYQKKYYPDNKLANRIRYILAWPCIRT